MLNKDVYINSYIEFGQYWALPTLDKGLKKDHMI